MAESMKDYEKELEESMKKIEEGDILTGTVISVDEKEVILDLKYYAEGVIPVEDYSREPGFNIKEEVHEGDEVSATVVRKDDGHGNILLSRVEASDILAWDKLEELKTSGEVIDVVVKGITNAGVIAYVEGVRGFIPASKLALGYVEDTEEYLNKPIQVQVIDVDKDSKKLILSAKEILRAKAEEERKNKVSNLEIGLVTEGTVESLQPYGAFVDLGNGLSGLVHISQICEKRIKKPSEVLAVGDKVKVKVTAIKDGKLSLSIKEASDMMAKEIEVKLRKLSNIVPDFFIICMENMRAILVHMDSLYIFCKNISCNVRSFVDHQNRFACLFCFMCKYRTIQSCTNYQIIIMIVHKTNPPAKFPILTPVIPVSEFPVSSYSGHYLND